MELFGYFKPSRIFVNSFQSNIGSTLPEEYFLKSLGEGFA